jgi:hypothetical protein
MDAQAVDRLLTLCNAVRRNAGRSLFDDSAVLHAIMTLAENADLIVSLCNAHKAAELTEQAEADGFGVPSLQDELTRKTLETYQWIVEKSSNAEMSDSEVKVALQTAFNITCGLVPSDITRAAEVAEGDAHAKAELVRVFAGCHALHVVRWKYGENTFQVTTRDSGFGEITVRPSTDLLEPSKALQGFHNFCQKLISSGYIEIPTT